MLVEHHDRNPRPVDNILQLIVAAIRLFALREQKMRLVNKSNINRGIRCMRVDKCGRLADYFPIFLRQTKLVRDLFIDRNLLIVVDEKIAPDAAILLFRPAL